MTEAAIITSYKYIPEKSSNASMYYEGTYVGPVTSQDLVDKIGDGSWGHRVPFLQNGRFIYIKQTD
jgi:hypothetical protein